MSRLDQRLVDQNLAPSRAQAQAMIAEGHVQIDGQVILKPADRREGTITVAAHSRHWVSRAAQKLAHALDQFDLVPHGIAVDIGASTGGFTQVLLERGVDHVHAIDVGHGQLHPDLIGNPKVTNHERVNARDLPPGLVPAPDWVVSDVSFISLEKALPPVLAQAKAGAILIALIKPQFEAGRQHVGKGGIVKDPTVHQACCTRIQEWLADLGWQVLGLTDSPITGSDGNREFLIAAQKTTTPHQRP